MAKEHPHKLGSVGREKGVISIIRELIFGAEDGLVSILGLVTGVATGTANSKVVLVAGVAGAVSGAISMAVGNYLGVKAHIEVLERLLKQERESILEQPEHERAELINYYRERGLTLDEIRVIVPAIMRNEGFLLEEMSAHELGISPRELTSPVTKAFWMFVAYIIAALLPILPYAFLTQNHALKISILGTLIALFGIGAGKTVYTKRNWLKSGFEMLIMAVVAGLLGYLAGRIVHL